MSCSFYVDAGQLTSAKTAPYLIALSTASSVISLIIGAYPSSNPSSSWSEERRASTYAKLLAVGWVEAKVRTVSLATNRTSIFPLYFPMTTASVTLDQISVDRLVKMTD